MAGSGLMLVALSFYFLFVKHSVPTLRTSAESYIQID